jgi:protoheme IX farnesyltransferase
VTDAAGAAASGESHRPWGTSLRDWLEIAKPRLSALVVLTCATGLKIAPATIAPSRAAAAIFFAALLIASANAVNSTLERDLDRCMQRTHDRPLAAGRVRATEALVFAVLCTVIATAGLFLFGNWLTALLGALAWVSYVWVYTPLKRRTALALLVGAVPGAVPALMGWTAVTGQVGLSALALPVLVYLWQIPHFLAISIVLGSDYERVGIITAITVYGPETTRKILAGSSGLLLLATPVVTTWLFDGWLATAAASALSLILFGLSLSGQTSRAPADWARRFFFATLAYLPAVLFLCIVAART